MSEQNENLEKNTPPAAETGNADSTVDKLKKTAADLTDKINANETVSNAKDKVKEAAAKVQENETISAAVDKLNNNKYVQQAKKSKHYKLIRLGAIVAVILVVFGLGKALFGDKYAAKAERTVVSVYKQNLEEYGFCTNISVKTKVIGKNKGAHLYLVDTKSSFKYSGEKMNDTAFVIVYAAADEAYIVREIGYDKSSKAEQKAIAISMLSRG